jgi:hypothetical protein
MTPVNDAGTEEKVPGICAVCGLASSADDGVCRRCGHPAVREETARIILEASELAADGLMDSAIRKFLQAVRTEPDSYISRLKLASAYARRGLEGEETLLKLAEREYDTALRLAPLERRVHLARLGLAAKLGRLPALRAEYEARSGELPFAGECLRMISVLENTPTVVRGEIPGEGKRKARYLFMGAATAGLTGSLTLFIVIFRTIQRGGIDVFSAEFVLCVVLFTAAGAMTADGIRMAKKKE